MKEVPFELESWMWFGVVMFVAICRYASRILLFGSPLRMQFDDYAMLLALATYTAFIVTINIEVQHSSNLLPPDYDYTQMTDAEKSERAFGSKMVLVVEICQCVCIWTVKACILALYCRITVAYKENLAIKCLAAYVAIGFVVMEVLYLGVWCTPFDQYWAVPSMNPQCTAATNHLITNAVLNISSDAAMILIAMNIILRSMLPLRKKAILGGVFGLGVFVIISAALNKAFSFTDPYGLAWTRWYVRESSTALLVGNLPLTWNLWRRLFALAPFHHRSKTTTVLSGPPYASRTQRSDQSSGTARSGEWLEILEGNSPDLEASGGREWPKPHKYDRSNDWMTSSSSPSLAAPKTRVDSTLGLHLAPERKDSQHK